MNLDPALEKDRRLRTWRISKSPRESEKFVGPVSPSRHERQHDVRRTWSRQAGSHSPFSIPPPLHSVRTLCSSGRLEHKCQDSLETVANPKGFSGAEAPDSQDYLAATSFL